MKRKNYLSRREFLDKTGKMVFGCAAGLGAAQFHGCTKRKRSGWRSNIIFILADDLGYGELGCYGQVKIKTPNLDRMAHQGMRFTDHYAGSTVCAPSRCSLMTGKHAGHATIRGNHPDGQDNVVVPLEPDDVTVAEVLKKGGYVTGVIGKWALGTGSSTGMPTLQGFDEFFGYMTNTEAHRYYPSYLWRNEEKVELKENRDGNNAYSHDLFTAEALEFIRRHRANPFYLYLAYTIPHSPYNPPIDAPYSDQPWPEAMKKYAAMITRMDSDVGRISALLEELNLDKNTLVMFSSDNGPGSSYNESGRRTVEFFDSNGPLRGIKRDLYEGGIRVPMIARWPGKIRAGSICDHASAFWDFLPTAAELAGLEAPGDSDGISMLPVLLGKPQKAHQFLYWEFHRWNRQAVRMGHWKGIRFGTEGKLELYDLKNDIGEKNNVAAEHPEIVAEIENYLRTVRTYSEHFDIGLEGQ